MEEKKTFWKRLVRSADNITSWAFSARKLTALAIMICVLTGHGIYYKHCYTKEDFSMFDVILIIDYIAIAFFLGLVTIQQIIEFKNGKKNEEPIKSTEPTPNPDNIVQLYV
jgi:hypothetical protein